MKFSRAANRYAKAILDLAVDHSSADALRKDMATIAQTLDSNKELRQFLSSPLIKMDKKRSALSEIFPSDNAITNGSFDLLANNNRMDILGDVAFRYIFLYEEMNRREIATVTTAVPLTDDLEKRILAKAEELAGKQVTLRHQIDESIIGGFILRVGDKQINASIQNKLNELRREFTV